jgi:hypothetical protein
MTLPLPSFGLAILYDICESLTGSEMRKLGQNELCPSHHPSFHASSSSSTISGSGARLAHTSPGTMSTVARGSRVRLTCAITHSFQECTLSFGEYLQSQDIGGKPTHHVLCTMISPSTPHLMGLFGCGMPRPRNSPHSSNISAIIYSGWLPSTDRHWNLRMASIRLL